MVSPTGGADCAEAAETSSSNVAMPNPNERTQLKRLLFVFERNREDRTVWTKLKRITNSIPRIERAKHWIFELNYGQRPWQLGFGNSAAPQQMQSSTSVLFLPMR